MYINIFKPANPVGCNDWSCQLTGVHLLDEDKTRHLADMYASDPDV